MNQWFKGLISRFNTHYIPSNYDKLTKYQLIQKIQTLENQLKKTSHEKQPRIHREHKPFDIKEYEQRRIALKVAYLGWNYSGFASQGDSLSVPTVEDQLFKALQSCRLIAAPETSQFTRCGRTDKGVSGLGQVVALNVRSHHSKHGGTTEPLPYIEILNRLLPDDIRILAWAPVSPTFNARFDCQSRTYKYFFEKDQLDLDLMRQAAQYMLGPHDFRNFCKLDPSKNINNYERTVVSLDIEPLEQGFCQVTLKGTAFLWHQVRCMMAILFLVGQKLEKPDIVKTLLDVDLVSSRPEYPMASDLPLLLYDCEFNDIQWIYANENNAASMIPTPLRTYRHFHELWNSHMIKGLLYQTVFEQIKTDSVVHQERLAKFIETNNQQQSAILLGAGKSIRTSKYKPLLTRPRADSDEVKKLKYKIRQSKKGKEINL